MESEHNKRIGGKPMIAKRMQGIQGIWSFLVNNKKNNFNFIVSIISKHLSWGSISKGGE